MTADVVKLGTPRAPLLGADDPPPFEVVNADGRARVVLFCDHASCQVPAVLDGLGLDGAVIRRHIGWDIGAGDVTRRLAALLDAAAVLAGYSRLVIDCNRPPGEPSSIPRVSDGVAVPGNQALGAAELAARQTACFTPYHEAVDAVIADVEARHGGPAAVISMHSFTPVMDGYERPWHVGILWYEDGRMPKPVIAALAADPSILVGDNQPYSGRVPVPYSIPAHAHPADRPHITVEIRQDLIDTHHGAEAWANIMAAAFAGPLADPALYRAAEA